MSLRRVSTLAIHFPHAVTRITEVMKQGAATHPGDPWTKQSVAEIQEHVIGHWLRYWQLNGPDDRLSPEDDLAHLICRLLMLLEKREEM